MNAISSSNTPFVSSNINAAAMTMRGNQLSVGQAGRTGLQQASFNNQQVQQQLPLINNLLQQLRGGQTNSVNGSASAGDGSGNTSTSGSALTDGQAETLTYTREEEKLARDVYKTLGDLWGINSFNNIASSEQQHMDTMARQLENYGLEDPVKDDTVGVFTNPELADLYQQLVERGSQSPQEALQVGAYIEELDMLDLQQAIDEAADQPALVSSYENLLKGSRNHMRSFVGQIEKQGVDYEAQLLSQDVVDQITASGIERGKVGSG